jgi:hypothetical protein
MSLSATSLHLSSGQRESLNPSFPKNNLLQTKTYLIPRIFHIFVMGQKHWSVEERDYFSQVLIPQSVYATGDFVASSGRTFKELASVMQADLDALGQSRRTYTEQILFQHWYQKERKGPSANSK